MAHLLPPKMESEEPLENPKTTFHGQEETNYKGQSWTAPPSGLGSIVRASYRHQQRMAMIKQGMHPDPAEEQD